MSSPFATYANATLRFQVASGELVTDPTNGNVKPGVAVVEVAAMLQQKRDPNREARPGVDTSAVWCEGYITSIVGQDSLVLPSVVTVDSVCAAVWQGRQGRFYLEFTARNPYIAALGIDLVERIRGYFQLGSFVVTGEIWTPTPHAGGEGDRQSAEADSPITAGQVLYLKQSGHLDLASAAAIGTARACGLAITSGAAATAIDYSTDGVIELPDWTAITGTASLSPGQIYFLDTQPGMLTLLAPTLDGQVVVNVGIALSSTTLSIEIQTPIAL